MYFESMLCVFVMPFNKIKWCNIHVFEMFFHIFGVLEEHSKSTTDKSDVLQAKDAHKWQI